MLPRNRPTRPKDRMSQEWHARQHREKSRDGLGPCAGLRSWHVAVRPVRAWLEPGSMLGRYRQGLSGTPPPLALQRLLDWLWEGRAISFYIRCQHTPNRMLGVAECWPHP